MTPKPEILSGFDGSKVGPLKGSTDIYDTTAHRQRYAADLGLLVQDGVRIVRVCIPYHLIDRGVYDWTWTDAYMNCMRELGLTPIVDPVHHASFPPWCIGGFSHPEFQDRYLAFMEAFVERYPWVTHFTVINEPVFTTWFCARQGIWHPRRRGDDAFVRMLNDVCKTICTISNMLIDRVPGLTLVHPDRSEKNHGVDEAGFLHARLLNEIRWIVLDLALGMVDKTHPLLWYLTMNGRMTDEDFAWFQEHRIKEPKRLIVGVDYYPHSEVAWGEHRRIQRHPHAIGLDGVTREYVDRYAPLGCRFAITETNVRGRIADRISWLKYVMETVEKLTSTGIALEGVTWFPFIDSTCWGNLLCNTRGSIDPQGIYWLREDTLERMPSELSELHALLAQGKITSQEIPAYQFEPGPVLNGRMVGNFLKFMQGWRWIDPSPEEIKPWDWERVLRRFAP